MVERWNAISYSLTGFQIFVKLRNRNEITIGFDSFFCTFSSLQKY